VQRELVERARLGDAEAFSSLAGPAADRLFAVAFRILRDHDRAEDATQRALIETWEHLPSLRDPDRFEAWTYRLVVRAAIREARRDAPWAAPLRLTDIELPAGGDPAAEVAANDELERAFRRLSPEHRAVLVLRYFAGLPEAKIAEIIGRSVGTVGSRLHYATRNLRGALEADARGVLMKGRVV